MSLDTYERIKRRYGPESPDALSCALNLACDTRPPATIPARELAAEVRSSYLSSVGESHPFTLAAASNLAICLHGVGEDASQCG